MLVLFTDTDTDITRKEAESYGYRLISMPYIVDGKEVLPYVDFDEFDYKPFYQMLRDGNLPTTSLISEEQYIEYFEPVFAEGNDILYVHFSRAMSSTFDNMDRAVRKLREKYPEREFYEIDTKGITTISYSIVCEIGEMFKNGCSLEEVLAWAEKEVDKHAMYFFADDLKFFKRSGRVTGIAGTIGTLLKIRPIIHMDSEGRMVSIGKERSRGKAIDKLFEYMEELGDNVKDHLIVVGHTGAPDIADELVNRLHEIYGNDINLKVVVTNPTAGSHSGPDGAAICFHAKHR